LIDDQDCDAELPQAADENFNFDDKRPLERHGTSPFLSIIHAVRSISQLTKSLKSTVITTSSIEAYEKHFSACLDSLPPHFQANSNRYIDPRSLGPMILLQNLRLILHRHNFSPLCPQEARNSAVDCCLAAAHDTTRILSRCMHDSAPSAPRAIPAGGGDWRSLMASAASTMLCIHIWRCTLLLLFRSDYAAALICIQISSVIGEARIVNSACGRYTAFFLRCLLDKFQRGEAPGLERDEEMMAYVSGDLQRSTDNGWVWNDNETGSELGAGSPESATSNPSMRGGHVSNTAHVSALPADESGRHWEGWEWVERTVQYLLNEQQKHNQTIPDKREAQVSASSESRPREPSLSTTSAPGSSGTPQRSNPGGNSRMTIANII
jgi:hypothetical protein